MCRWKFKFITTFMQNVFSFKYCCSDLSKLKTYSYIAVAVSNLMFFEGPTEFF